jgi:L-arabinose isomerase
MIRARIGLVVLYVPFYEKIAPVRDEKVEFARAVSAQLAATFDVYDCGIVSSEEEARDAGARLASEQVDAVVVVPAVATFGALGWAALEQLTQPVCLWNIQPDNGVPPAYDIRALIRNSGGLGIQALANTLARAGRAFTVAFSAAGDALPAKLEAFVEAAAAWRSLQRARFATIGTVFEQMTDIAMDRTRWPGREMPLIPSADILYWYERQNETTVAARVRELRCAHAVEEITDDELSRSARLSLALDAIVGERSLDGGAFNCHGGNCLQNKSIGVTACYGVSRQTSEGRPFSCTGDLPTAIAMKILQDMAGVVLYGELDLVDPGRDVVLLANGGEGHFGAAAGPVTIAGNENFAGLHGRGASLRFEPFSGAATILSFTPLSADSRYRMIAAEGTLEPSPPTRLGVFHAGFRFQQLRAADAFEHWCEAGAVHHLALAPGNWLSHLKHVARMSGFELVVIGGGSK